MPRLSIQSILSVALAAAALAAPGSAGASPTSALTAGDLTITGDGSDNVLTLTVANGVLALNGNPTGAPADGSADITVKANGGLDIVDARALPAGSYRVLTISGGDDRDRLQGGGGHDVISGDGGDDSLAANGGDDFLDGGAGSNSLDGGTGNDRFEWFRETTTQVLGGEGQDAVVARGSSGTDAFSLQPRVGGQKMLDPTAGGTRGRLDLFDTEHLDVVAGGGGDSFSVLPGVTGLTLSVFGEAGDDVLRGSPGRDTLVGGTGSDTLDGVDGDDQIFARDGDHDDVVGGAGIDSAQTDRLTLDAVSGVESVDALPATEPPSPTPPSPTPPSPTPTLPPPALAGARDGKALLPRLGKVVLVRSRGRLVARVPLACPSAEKGGCAVALRLTTPKGTRLGSKSLALRSGRRVTASIRLARTTARSARKGRVSVQLALSSSDAARNRSRRIVRLRLRVPPRQTRRSAAAVASATRSVAVRNNRFSPGRLTIRRGSKVVWRWQSGGVPHNVTPTRGGRGSATSSRKGHRFSRSFARRGTFQYVCTIHPAAMRLTLKVR